MTLKVGLDPWTTIRSQSNPLRHQLPALSLFTRNAGPASVFQLCHAGRHAGRRNPDAPSRGACSHRFRFSPKIPSAGRTVDGFEDSISRDVDGVWQGPNGPTRRRVSAILSTERLTPWSLGQRRARLVVNPWARRPLTASPLDTDFWRVRDGVLERTAGASIAQLLDLSDGWPE